MSVMPVLVEPVDIVRAALIQRLVRAATIVAPGRVDTGRRPVFHKIAVSPTGWAFIDMRLKEVGMTAPCAVVHVVA